MRCDPMVRAFVEPKSDWDLAKCQDRFAVHSDRGILRVALSDGATDACLSDLWADLLVQASTCALPLLDIWGRKAWLPRLQGLASEWRMQAEARLAPNRSWLASNALARGSYASLLQLEVCGRRWHAKAVGDSCLLLVRKRSIRRSFPMSDPAAFRQRPALLATRLELNGKRPSFVRQEAGCLIPGDCLLLASDALACRLLAAGDAHELLEHINAPRAEAAFRDWVHTERRCGRLRDDDTTLLILEA